MLRYLNYPSLVHCTAHDLCAYHVIIFQRRPVGPQFLSQRSLFVTLSASSQAITGSSVADCLFNIDFFFLPPKKESSALPGLRHGPYKKKKSVFSSQIKFTCHHDGAHCWQLALCSFCDPTLKISLPFGNYVHIASMAPPSTHRVSAHFSSTHSGPFLIGRIF